MPRGGRREGAGRKTNAEREAIRNATTEKLERFAKKSLADLDAIYEAQKALALGLYYEGCMACAKPVKKCRCKEGPQAVRIYQEPPNQKAGKDLMEHAKGRAAQAAQVQHETQITVSLGCKKCGNTEPLIPRPKARSKEEESDLSGTIDERREASLPDGEV